MNDITLLQPTEPEDSWNLDVAIRAGRFVLRDKGSTSNDQRATVAAYLLKGSIPGKEDYGVDWSETYVNMSASAILNMGDRVTRQINELVGSDGSINDTYMATIAISDGKAQINILKAGQDNGTT